MNVCMCECDIHTQWCHAKPVQSLCVCVCVSYITESVSPLLAKLWAGKVLGDLTHLPKLNTKTKQEGKVRDKASRMEQSWITYCGLPG